MMEQRMRILLGVLIVMIMAWPAHADDDGLDYNLVNLSADAVREVPNDLGMVTLEVRHQGRDAAALPNLVNTDMNWALDKARAVAAITAETRHYSTQPHYESGRIVGWTATQSLYLESKDFGALSELVTALQERLKVSSMNFGTSRELRDSLEDELTEEAIAAFKAKAALITRALGADDYELVNLSVNGNSNVAPPRAYARMAMADAAVAAAPVAMQSGNATLMVSVNGRIQLR